MDMFRFHLGDGEMVMVTGLLRADGNNTFTVISIDGSFIPEVGYCETHDFYYELEMTGCPFLKDIFGSCEKIMNPNIVTGRTWEEIKADTNSHWWAYNHLSGNEYTIIKNDFNS